MLTDSRITYLFVYVKNMEAARDFYEKKLGFMVIEEDEVAVKYSAGHVILALNRAADFGVTLRGSNDDSSLIVFQVNDIDASRTTLEEKGVTFAGGVERYDIGATTSFYDLDGHCFTLYEPSEEALGWPSGEKVRNVVKEDFSSEKLMLGDRKMLYLFLFVSTYEGAFEFYHKKLGLRVLEESKDAGVTKYDGGGILLTTHVIEGDEATSAGEEAIRFPKSIAPVFNVSDTEEAYKTLKKRGVTFSGGIDTLPIGTIAKFEDPDGHMFYLYCPSDEALELPSGEKIKQILSEKL